VVRQYLGWVERSDTIIDRSYEVDGFRFISVTLKTAKQMSYQRTASVARMSEATSGWLCRAPHIALLVPATCLLTKFWTTSCQSYRNRSNESDFAVG
jgi:hypothetical protein